MMNIVSLKIPNFDNIIAQTKWGRFASRGTHSSFLLFAKETTNRGLNAFLFTGFVEGILTSSGSTISRKTIYEKEITIKKCLFDLHKQLICSNFSVYLRYSCRSSRPAPGWVWVILSSRRARGTGGGVESMRARALHSSPSFEFCRVETYLVNPNSDS